MALNTVNVAHRSSSSFRLIFFLSFTFSLQSTLPLSSSSFNKLVANGIAYYGMDNGIWAFILCILLTFANTNLFAAFDDDDDFVVVLHASTAHLSQPAL